ncbi:F-box/kelch-repeat protein At4g33290 [Arabidopsis lyrata subsp. lyrata]|uniref:F-box/kelch-repeat protein At4g33290 n=1 Tax=Arabidopsis lyrata subsp. lyrata TaxID=81972 RepID=UPI000A29A23D|nr:F-box/kelch-repeat protein At4g33290 [Arabidopsis lyrata subsp. lyrata]|eukprot:XP_020887711.1 F-box/kelch-repeat protein At4g33290 [Arabidopsis lyrata subsp. lyrata]
MGNPDKHFIKIVKDLILASHPKQVFAPTNTRPKSDYAAEKNANLEEVFTSSIICFDFTSERFGPLLHLSFSTDGHHDYITLSCVREEKLAVLLHYNKSNPYKLFFWIEIEEVSWRRFLRVATGFGIYVPFINGIFFIDEEKKIVIGFDNDNRHRVIVIGEAKYIRGFDLVRDFGDQECKTDLCSYVPSLVQIKAIWKSVDMMKTF